MEFRFGILARTLTGIELAAGKLVTTSCSASKAHNIVLCFFILKIHLFKQIMDDEYVSSFPIPQPA